MQITFHEMANTEFLQCCHVYSVTHNAWIDWFFYVFENTLSSPQCCCYKDENGDICVDCENIRDFFGWLCRSTVDKRDMRDVLATRESNLEKCARWTDMYGKYIPGFSNNYYLILYKLYIGEDCASFGDYLSLSSPGESHGGVYKTTINKKSNVMVVSHYDPNDSPTGSEMLFEDWFDMVGADVICEYCSNDIYCSEIAKLRRAPGGYHEWLMVCSTHELKLMGIPGKWLRYLMTPTYECRFVLIGEEKERVHGGVGSTLFHSDLRECIRAVCNSGDERYALFCNLVRFGRTYQANALLELLCSPEFKKLPKTDDLPDVNEILLT